MSAGAPSTVSGHRHTYVTKWRRDDKEKCWWRLYQCFVAGKVHAGCRTVFDNGTVQP